MDRIDRLVRRAVSSGQPQRLENERIDLLLRNVGAYTVHAIPIDDGADDVRVVLCVMDLGSTANTQNQLLRVEKLATVGVLAAGIAHEVGTPLGVIRGRAEVIQKKLGPEHALTASVGVIIDQIDRVSRTIRALLDFARTRPVTAGELNVKRPIERVRDLVKFEVEKRQLQLSTEIATDVPLIYAEADKIEQILVNLVMNAIDATPPGGQVTISASRAVGDVPRVALRVRDTGCGIPPEQLHQVFDPFFTTKGFQQGTGLGLAIVNQLVHDHRGEVNLSSAIGRGTMVEVLLPAAIGER